MSNKTISEILTEIGPKKVTGDQGEFTARSISEAIMANEYEKKQNAASSRKKMRGVLRAIGGFRLGHHDGRAS